MHIELGDDGRYNAIRIGTITFEREKASLFTSKMLCLYLGERRTWSL